MFADAVDALRAGGVIAYPTEGVYGLGCDPKNDAALQRLIDIKGRDSHKGFILVASNQSQLAQFLAPIEPAWQTQLDAHWPGAFTFVIPAAETISPLLSGYRATIAVRVSAHPTVKDLCEKADSALVSTSANRSGHAPLLSGDEVKAEFGSALDFIVAGNLGELTAPTRIIDVRDGSIIR